MKTIRDFVLDYLQKEYTFPNGADVDAINYVESGYIDSLALVKFVIELEDEFEIEFSDGELSSPAFKSVGELIKLVEGKVEQNENS